jgi:hypothetical protein
MEVRGSTFSLQSDARAFDYDAREPSIDHSRGLLAPAYVRRNGRRILR